MTTANTIAAAIANLLQQIAAQEATNPLYAQRDSLVAQLQSVMQQINVLEAQTDTRTARITLVKLQNVQNQNAQGANVQGQQGQ